MNKNIGKTLSYLLRHGLEKENIIHTNGFVLIDDIISWLHNRNMNITYEDIVTIVNNDKKQRYLIEGNNMRANQGHSFEANIEYDIVTDIHDVYPIVHATYKEHIANIMMDGLKLMSRTHIHFASIKTNDFNLLRKDTDTYCVLNKNYSEKMYLSKNNVYLSDNPISKNNFNIVTFTKKLNCYGGIIFDDCFENVIIVKTHMNNSGFPKGKRHS